MNEQSLKRQEFLEKVAEIALTTNRLDSYLSFQTNGAGALCFCIGNEITGQSFTLPPAEIKTIDSMGAEAIALAGEYASRIGSSYSYARKTTEMRVFIDNWESCQVVKAAD